MFIFWVRSVQNILQKLEIPYFRILSKNSNLLGSVTKGILLGEHSQS